MSSSTVCPTVARVRCCPPRLVVVAERQPVSPGAAPPSERSLRMMSARYVAQLDEQVRSAGFEFVSYDDPSSFMEHLAEHRGDVVLSLWHGNRSRNAVAMMPAICEAYGIPIIGADAYARVICDDKALSRDFAKRIGFQVPSGCVIECEDDLAALAGCPLPAVVKPTMGGNSMGVVMVGPGSGPDYLIECARATLLHFNGPVLVEAFQPGREVMVVIIGDQHDVAVLEAVELYKLDDERYFEDKIFDAALKQRMPRTEWSFRPANALVGDAVLTLCRAAFRRLGSPQYLRIDGRVHGGGFTFLELSPTPHFQFLSALSAVARGRGETPADMLRRLVTLCLRTEEG